jgi:hypothetical protein
MVYAKYLKIVMHGIDPRSNSKRHGIYDIEVFTRD